LGREVHRSIAAIACHHPSSRPLSDWYTRHARHIRPANQPL